MNRQENSPEPILDRARMFLVFLGQEEVNEVFVGHSAFRLRIGNDDAGREDSLNDSRRQRRIVMLGHIVLVDPEVVVVVQFPKFAVDNVEVFVREVVRDLRCVGEYSVEFR